MKKSEGVVLFAFGHYVYYWAMYNLVFSIRQHSPSVKIVCYVGDIAKAGHYCTDLLSVCDDIREIAHEDYHTGEKFDPGKLKVNIYKYLPFDYNLYLDVDAVCLKDITPLLAELKATGKYYASHTVGYHTIDKGRNIPSMQWAWGDTIWEKYNLPSTAVLPAINSSLQYIVKGKESKALYDTAKRLYTHDPIPVNKLRMKWGGGQPDELYMNIAMAMLNHDPACSEVGSDGAEKGFIHFAMRRGKSYKEVTDEYYFQSYYGGRGFTAAFYIEWLDRMLNKMQRESGGAHQYTINRILKYKHADNK